jgi:hypothetical protein
MKLSDFIMLNEEEKKLAVVHLGIFIRERKTPGSIVFPFHFLNF